MRKLLPKSEFIGQIAPGRHLAEFSLELLNVRSMTSIPSNVLEILTKHRVKLLEGFHDPSHWSFFADISESDIDIHGLQEELKVVPGVVNVVTVDSKDGFLIDSLHFPYVWGEVRTVSVRAETLSNMLNRLKKVFGEQSAVAKVVIYQLGEAAGSSMYKANKTQFGAKFHTDLANVMNMYTASGWGIFRVSDVDLKVNSATVAVQNNFECEYYEGSGSLPISDFVRGHLSGLFTEIFGRRVKSLEKLCLAQGDAYCEFDIQPMITSV